LNLSAFRITISTSVSHPTGWDLCSLKQLDVSFSQLHGPISLWVREYDLHGAPSFIRKQPYGYDTFKPEKPL
jgi:hypothetical protein